MVGDSSLLCFYNIFYKLQFVKCDVLTLYILYKLYGLTGEEIKSVEGKIIE